MLQNVPIQAEHSLCQTTLIGHLAGVEWLHHSWRVGDRFLILSFTKRVAS
ncbi:hypothetical protein H6F52_12325 [Coleofasciculus sp. FACHB-542]|nr:hypothetical protein [Coleofasciculus sp. FACHB-542]